MFKESAKRNQTLVFKESVKRNQALVFKESAKRNQALAFKKAQSTASIPVCGEHFRVNNPQNICASQSYCISCAPKSHHSVRTHKLN